jgi:DNA-directed RNA polymerase subunit M/transcription elongation factor TFIIS
MASICSKHQRYDIDCPICNSMFDLDEPDRNELLTCSKCNYTYYKRADICPNCCKEN